MSIGTDAPAAVSTLNPGPTVVPSDGPSGDSAGFTVAPANVPTSRHNDQDGGTLGNPKDLNTSRVITDKHVPIISVRISLSSSFKTCQSSMSNEKH